MFKKLLLFFTLLTIGFADKCFEKIEVINSDKLFFYQDKVYDITGYNHPGGSTTLKKTIGEDLENYVTQPDYDFHLTSSSFKKDLLDMYVGVLKDTCETSTSIPTSIPTSTTTSTSIPITTNNCVCTTSTTSTTSPTSTTSTTKIPTTTIPITTRTIPTTAPSTNCSLVYNYTSSIPYTLQNLKAESNVNNIKQVNGYLTLNLVENFGGARLSTTEYFQYGEINAVLKVAKGVNVITAFYIEADNGDMVVFNIIQNDKNKNSMIETNFFYQGNMIYDINAEFFTTLDTILYETFNTYTIVWHPTYYEWRLNNVLLRRLDIQNTLTFPNSPSKVKLSIWEGPVSSWAGSGIDWKQNSIYFSELSSLIITNYCSGNYSRNFSYIENFNNTSEPTKSLGLNNLKNDIYLLLVSITFLFLL